LVIGLKIIGSENRVEWDLREPGRVGLENFELGSENIVSVEAEAASGGKRTIKVIASKPFKLQLKIRNKRIDFDINSGKSQHEV